MAARKHIDVFVFECLVDDLIGGLAADHLRLSRVVRDEIDPAMMAIGPGDPRYPRRLLDLRHPPDPLWVEGGNVPEGQMPPLRRFKSIAPGYFETMGNPLVAGRAVTWTDIYQLRPVVIISETLAREYWGNASNALGKRVRCAASRSQGRGVIPIRTTRCGASASKTSSSAGDPPCRRVGELQPSSGRE